MNETESTIPPASERTTTLVEGGIPTVSVADVAAATPPTDTRNHAEAPRLENPLADVKPERPKTHPVAYAALALALLALVLSIMAMGDDGDGYRRVRVGNADCVIGPHQDDADALYCVAGTVPNS